MAGGQHLQTSSNFNEARNNGHLLDVWQAESADHRVWMSLDNGDPFTLGVTETNVSPMVAAYGESDFMIIHTGVDGRIYYSVIFVNSGNNLVWSGEWTAVPGQSTNLAVSAVQWQPGQNEIYMVYRGSGNDTRIWGTYYSPLTGWTTAENISGGLSNSAPAITYDPQTEQHYVVAQGVNGNQLYITHDNGYLNGDDEASWGGWTNLQIQTNASPSIAASTNGNSAISIMDADAQPQFGIYNCDEERVTSPWITGTPANWFTNNPVVLTAVVGVIYALFIGQNNEGYYKPIFNP